MLRYLGKRFLKCAITIIAAAALIFTILYFAPPDPIYILLG